MPLSHGIFLKDKAQCNIGDRIPIKNIIPFGNCTITSPPPPCVPATLLPWVNKKDTTLSLNGQKALIKNAICVCAIGGIITIEDRKLERFYGRSIITMKAQYQISIYKLEMK